MTEPTLLKTQRHAIQVEVVASAQTVDPDAAARTYVAMALAQLGVPVALSQSAA